MLLSPPIISYLRNKRSIFSDFDTIFLGLYLHNIRIYVPTKLFPEKMSPTLPFQYSPAVISTTIYKSCCSHQGEGRDASPAVISKRSEKSPVVMAEVVFCG